MKKLIALFLISTILIFTDQVQIQAQACATGEVEVEVIIVEDNWADTETDWQIIDANGTVLASGSPDGASICVAATACLTFTITDTYGDGLRGLPPNFPAGSFEVLYDGSQVAYGVDFGSEFSTSFGNCPPGSSCAYAENAVEDNTYNTFYTNTWYAFVPTTTGQYEISTCGANCATTAWVYDICEGLVWDDTQEAGLAFADSGCPATDEALLVTSLFAGTTYYIRIKTDCAPTVWTLSFLGEISGCTDVNACNYDPVATINDPAVCLYPGDPNCPDGPDLVIVASEIANTISFEVKNNDDGCFVSEGCMNGYGDREIIRFTTRIDNIGNQDYYIGSTPNDQNANDPQWEWDDCHNHWHYEGYAEYVLYDDQGVEIPIGFKNGFCVIDLDCPPGISAKYNCGNQGITAGCGDIYHSGLNCQWIDITEVAAGFYTLVVRVNWDNSPDKLGHYELDINNNWAQVCIEIVRDGNGDVSAVNLVNDCPEFTDCFGNVYGSAQPDCEGVCNGGRSAGDLDADGSFDVDDITAYTSGILANTLTADACTDLNTDNTINVADIALLMGCMLEEQGVHTHSNGAHDHCNLPNLGVINGTQSVTLSIGDVNYGAGYLDINILNPNAFILGAQFVIEGLNIVGVLPLPSETDMTTNFNATTGVIIGYSTADMPVARYTSEAPFLRVFFDSAEPEVCISSIVSIVNDDYEEVIGLLGDNCYQLRSSLHVKALLEGVYDPASNQLNPLLYSAGVLEITQPYQAEPWTYAGTESVSMLTELPNTTIDWVLLELRDASDLNTVIAAKAATIQYNGTIVDVEALVEGESSGVYFWGLDRDTPYHICLRHRNHLDVISSGSIMFATHSEAMPYDFSSAANTAMGTNQQSDLGTGYFGLVAGDVDASGIVDVQDYNAYINDISLLNQYLDSDMNLDAAVTVGDFNAYFNNASIIGISLVRY